MLARYGARLLRRVEATIGMIVMGVAGASFGIAVVVLVLAVCVGAINVVLGILGK